MYLFRVLNQFDINSNILENGLVSKKLLYDITKNYYQTNKEYLELNSKERELFIKKNINNYLINHQNNLKKKYLKYCKDIFDIIDKMKNQTNPDPEVFMKMVYYISTLNNHLINGTKNYTEWISLSKSLNDIDKYYQSQSKHQIAIISSNTNGYIDEQSIAIDLSKRSIINDDKVLCNKIKYEDYLKYLNLKDIDLFIEHLVHQTKKQFMGYNYTVSDKEVCYYQYIPSNKIVSILEALQIDLIRCNLFNEDFLKLNRKEQQKNYENLKYKLLTLVQLMKEPYMLHIYEEVYLNNNNIELVTTNIFEKEKIKHTKKLILGLASKIPDIEIKR